MKPHGTKEQLPSGRWRVRRKDPASAKYKALGTVETEQEADALLASPTPRPGKVCLVDVWEKFAPERQRTSRDWRNDSGRWSLYVERHPIATVPLRELRRAHVLDWLAWLGKLGLAVQTRRNALNILRVALGWALDREMVAANVAAGIRVKREDTTKDPWTILMPDEQLALLSAVERDEWHAVAAALGLGLRNTEQWRLRWEDVDFEGHVVAIRYSVAGRGTKGGRVRRVPLFGVALDALRVAEERRKKGCPWVFPAPRTNDRRADSSHPTRWSEWLRAAGVTRDVRWYDLRHTCATSLLAGWWGRKWTLDEVQQMLGHASVTTTERYAHALDETLHRAGRGTGGVESHGPARERENQGASLGIRTPDLRFTNPDVLLGFSGLAVERFHAASTARDSRLAAVVLEGTRLAFDAGKSPLAKAKLRRLLEEGGELLEGARLCGGDDS